MKKSPSSSYVSSGWWWSWWVERRWLLCCCCCWEHLRVKKYNMSDIIEQLIYNLLPLIPAMPRLNLFVCTASTWHRANAFAHLHTAGVTPWPRWPTAELDLPPVMVTGRPAIVTISSAVHQIAATPFASRMDVELVAVVQGRRMQWRVMWRGPTSIRRCGVEWDFA